MANEDTDIQTNSHDDLVNYMISKNPSTDSSQIRNTVLGDPQAFNYALEGAYMNHAAGTGMDYQTFKASYLKINGDPFESKEDPQQKGSQSKISEPAKTEAPKASPQSDPATNPTNSTPQHEFNYQWGPKAASELATGDSRTHAPVEGNTVDEMPDSIRKYHEDIDKHIARDALGKRRNGDYTTPGDEIALRNEENPDYIQARLNSRNAFEIIFGADDPEIRSYTYSMGALSDDLNNLTLAMEVVAEQLQDKYGENVVNAQPGLGIGITEVEGAPPLEEITNDPLYNEYINYITGYNASLNKLKDLTQDPKFADARAYLENTEVFQAMADAGVTVGTTPTQPGSAVLPFAMRSGVKLLQGIGAVADIGEKLIFGDEAYGWGDMTQEFFMDLGSEVNRIMPMPTQFSRSVISTTGEYEIEGNKYQIDFDGDEIQGIRDQKGRLVRREFSEAQLEQMKGVEKSTKFNSGAFFYQGTQIATDLLVQVAASKGIGSGLSSVGVSQGLASQTAVTMGVAGQMIGPMYQEALESGDFATEEDAALYALSTSVMIGVGANLFGMESRLMGGPSGLLDDFLKVSPAALAARGAPNWLSRSASSATNVLRAAGGEVFEETVVENTIDAGTRMILNAPSNKIDKNELLSTAALSFAIGALGNIPTVNSNPYKGALYTAVTNPEKFEIAYRDLIDRGIVNPPIAADSPNREKAIDDHISAQSKRMRDLQNDLETTRPAIPKEVRDEDLLAILDQRRQLNLELHNMKQAGISRGVNKIEGQIRNINDQLADLAGIEKEPVAEGQEPEPVEPLPEEMQQTIDDAKTGSNAPDTFQVGERVELSPQIGGPAISVSEATNRRGIYQNQPGYLRYDPEESIFNFHTDQGQVISLDADPNQDVRTLGIRSLSDVSVQQGESEREIRFSSRPDQPFVYQGPTRGPQGEITGAQLTGPEGDVTITDPVMARRIDQVSRGEDPEAFPVPPPGVLPETELPAPKSPDQVLQEAVESPTPITSLDAPVIDEASTGITPPPEPPDAVDNTGGPPDPPDPEPQMSSQERKERAIHNLENQRSELQSQAEDLAIEFRGIEEQVALDPEFEPVDGESIKSAAEKEIQFHKNRINEDISAIRLKIRNLDRIIEMLGNARVTDIDAYIDSVETWTQNGAVEAYGVILAQDGELPTETLLKRIGNGIVDFSYNVGIKISSITPRGIRGNKMYQKLADALYKHGYARQRTPRFIDKKNARRINRVNGQMKKAKLHIDRVVKLFKQGKFKLTDQMHKRLNYALHDPDINQVWDGDGARYTFTGNREIDDQITEEIRHMRNQIDSMSKELIAMGVTDGELSGVIAKNLSLYVNRSYQVHTNPDWINEVWKRPDIINPARKWVRDHALSNIVSIDKAVGKVQKKLDEVNNRIKEMEDADERTTEYITLTNRAARYNSALEDMNKNRGVFLAQYNNPDGQLMAMLKKQREAAGLEGKGFGRKKEGSKDLGILQKIEDLDPELQRLYGVYESGLVNFAQTVFKQASLIESQRFISDIEDIGSGKIFFDTPRPGFDVLIAAEGSETMAPLNGLYTSPEILYTMENMNALSEMSTFGTLMFGMGSMIKKFKTVYSPIGQIRNPVSGGYFHIACGDFPGALTGIGAWLTGIVQVTANAVAGLFGKEVKLPPLPGVRLGSAQQASKIAFGIGARGDVDIDPDSFKELIDLGLTDENSVRGDMNNLLSSYQKGELTPDSIYPPGYNSRDSKFYRYTAGVAGEAGDAAERYYQASDDYHRLYRYLSDVARYSDAYGLRMEEVMKPGQFMDFKRRIADMAKNTYPTYSRIPRSIQALGRIPFIASFPSFAAEQVRVIGNNFHTAAKDIAEGVKTKNGKLTNLGLMRLAGTTTALLGIKFTSELLTPLLGLISSMNDDEEEEEKGKNHSPTWNDERQKWYHFLPPWVRNSMYSILNHEGESFYYVDFGPVVPNIDLANLIFNAVYATKTGDSRPMMESLGSVLSPFTSWDLWTKAAIETAINQKQLGKAIYVSNPEDPLTRQATDRVSSLAKKVAPGAVNSAYRLLATEELFPEIRTSPYHDYKLGLEAATYVAGVRITPGNIEESYKFRMIEYSERYRNALEIYRKKARALEKTAQNAGEILREQDRIDRLRSSYNRSEKAVRRILLEASQMYGYAIELGADEEKLNEHMKGSFSGAQKDGIKGGYVELPPIDNIDTKARGGRSGRSSRRSRER